jgi:predicted DsbA family dithiol-disulfide isomerase
LQTKLKEALMKAYFCEGADLTQNTTLTQIVIQSGLSAEAASAVLNDTAAHQEVASQDAELGKIGINGVPFFIINRKLGVSGAQSPQALLEAMEQVLASDSGA